MKHSIVKKQTNKNHPANSCGLDGLKSPPNAFIPNKKMQEQERTAEDACISKEERRESPKPSLQKTIPLAFAPFFLGGSACTVAGNQKQLTRKLLKQRSEQNMENKRNNPGNLKKIDQRKIQNNNDGQYIYIQKQNKTEENLPEENQG